MKRHLKITGIISLLALACITRCCGQALPDLQSGFDQYTKLSPQEKLYVHTDKNTYTAGELMWFKLYYVDGAYQRPADMSKVAYIEILDKEQYAVIQAKIELKNGTGSGSVFIPVNLASGNYVLRAYTSWMKNFEPEFYFHQQITVINPLKANEAQAKAATPAYDVQFFPEGGNLVNGINSTIAVKAVDQFGAGLDFRGAVLNKKNDTVARFTSYKFGMGRFEFKPDNQQSYHAVIKIGGKTIQKDLPKIYDSGYVMHVADDHSNLSVSVTTNTNATSVYLFVHTRNAVKLVQPATVENGVAHFTVDKNQPGDGISQLTVFDNDRRPVCERLYFKRPAKQLALSAGSDQLQYNTRSKVSIDIDAKDGDSKPAMANISLSVYKVDSLQHLDGQNIESYLWLASDLKGNIESPDYYFKNTGAEADEAADNLMLTQGWRRFRWDDILKNTSPAFSFMPEYNGPVILGKLTNQLTGKPVKDIIAYLAIPGKRVQMYPASSDSLGRLIFNMKGFYGPGEIVVQTNTVIDTIYHIDILNPFSEQYAKINLPPLTVNSGAQADMVNNSLSTQVQNIYSGDKLRQFYDPGLDSSAFYGPPYKTYLLDNYTRFTTMEEVMREYVSEVNITHSSKDGFHIKVISGNGFLRENDPMVLIDGIPFFNMNKLFAVDPLKIRKLEDVPYTYYWGPSVEEGIFSYTSYKGDLAGTEIDPHAVIMDYEGLEEQRVFYSPQYDTDKALNSRLPDFRNVLYWSPNVNTDAKGKNSLSFYTSDQTGRYVGVIQGMAADGEAGSQTFTFQVVK